MEGKSHSLTRPPATKQWTDTGSPLPFPLSRMGRRKGQKAKLIGGDKDS